MLNLGSGAAAPAPAGDLVKDGTDASFMADVIEASKGAAVIVDFHAEWCGPCKTLGPALESAVKAAGGKVKLVKVDIDQNPQFAAQLRVQSIPAVFAFVDGQPIDGFMGALPPSELKAFVDRVAAQGGAGASEAESLAEALDAADAMLAEGAVADAIETFAAVVEAAPENARAHAGLAGAFAAAGRADQARAALDAAPEAIRDDPALTAVRAQLDLAEQTSGVGEADALREKLAADPDDHQARFDLALALLGAGDQEGAIEELLELFRRDREWDDGAARAQLFRIFDSLGEKSALALKGRRRLSSMIFA
ncbi:tetratricopeptide repeat protein [Pikeienuella sp. HZG-20]|uniref:tetratricopeptide repeat protein n=1 Tax=Paludibacillus litoralis TaxID=3133267 RepID=UPI0030EC3AE9